MEINGKNILIISMLSTRDKVSGLYNLMQDGNINSMLNKLYINLNNFEKCIMTLPPRSLLNPQQFDDLSKIIHEKFESKILFYHTDYYGKNVALTRKSMMFSRNIFDEINSRIKIDLVVSEYPVNFGIGVNVIYNYNWNKVSDDDNTPSAEYFNEELKLSKYYKTYLFSKIQYDYMCSKTNNTENIILHKNIYSEDFLTYCSELEISKLDDKTKKSVDKIIKDNVLFYPLRVEDPRYKYEKCYQYAKDNNLTLVTTNHTNVDVKFSDVVDIRTIYPQHLNRPIYYYILSKLKNNDVILRYEDDMHVSLIEQTILSKSKIISPNFTNEEIKNYINYE